ncbi:GNAT family N-acetyltransferase [Candidatus Pantoea soli]|uniref:N-acetyltransferase family protein n=1 Tax=Candidatus Pantoea soli TaxID=3098669 RepID=A0A518XIR7_9GAMM|nr:GNAT family N-acetyltransferase [Pantoea soli]QDY44083.1 N-acetyltransferase family protein [Pantoea soli]
MDILPARPHHAADLQRIYAWHVLHGTATFETEPPAESEMRRRILDVQQRGGFWLVAQEQHQVLGYCYLAPYRPRYAYRFTLEDSIYLDPQQTGRGIGKALLQKAITLAETAGFRQIIAIVGDSANAGSLGLHRALGFKPTGVMKSVGFKHGRWLDTVVMQRSLGAGDSLPPAR